jgi:hypothetical protein
MLSQYGGDGMRTARDFLAPVGASNTRASTLVRTPSTVWSGFCASASSVCSPPSGFYCPCIGLHTNCTSLNFSCCSPCSLGSHRLFSVLLYLLRQCTTAKWKNWKQKPTHGPRYTHAHHRRGRRGHCGVSSVPETPQPSGPSTIDRHQMPPNGNSHVRSAGI